MASYNIRRATLVISLLGFFVRQAEAQQADLADLYRRKEYFVLERQFEKQRAQLPDRLQLFYQAVLDNTFNRPAASDRQIKNIRSRFRIGPANSLNKILLNLEADNATKLYDYRRAANTYQLIIDQCKPDSAERADILNSLALWGAIANVPPQAVVQRRDASLKWRKDKIGLVQVPVHAGKDSCDLVFDTGANLSVITETGAKKLHMQIYPVKLDLGAGTTGQTVQSSLAVADSLYLGDVLLRHVVFLLLPDDMLYFKQADYRQQGIIGLPLMVELGQINLYRDGRLVVPLHAERADGHNLALDGLMPIVEYAFKRDHLPFRFDSGASSSALYAPFYKRYQEFIKQNGQPYELKTGGVGGTINTAAAYQLKNVDFGVAGRAFRVPLINVRTTDVGQETDLFYGNMGLDIFGQFKQLTINFRYMYLQVLK